MRETKSERRSGLRVPVRVPVAINSPDGNLQTTGYTRDLSGSGIFLYSAGKIGMGSDLEMVLILPPELTNGEKRWVCCQASVVRVEPGASPGTFGVAANIRGLQMLPEISG
jgi:hypothetical protein